MQFICGGTWGNGFGWVSTCFNSSKYMAATCQVISFARLDGSTHVLFISFEVGELFALGHWFLLLGCHKTEEPLNGYGLHPGMNHVLRCVPSLDKRGLVLWIILHWGGTHVGITPIYGDVYVICLQFHPCMMKDSNVMYSYHAYHFTMSYDYQRKFSLKTSDLRTMVMVSIPTIPIILSTPSSCQPHLHVNHPSSSSWEV